VIGFLLGSALDRFSRRRLMVMSDLVRLACFVLLVVATTPYQIVALAGIVGFANGFFRPAAYAGMPNLVQDDELEDANALFQAAENLTWMIGPLLGGLAVAVADPDLAYLINAATFLVSALFVLRIPSRLLQSAQSLTRGHWSDLKEGFGFVWRSRPLVTVVVAWTIATVGSATINVSEIFFVRESLDGGNLALGLMLAAAGLGLVVGSLTAPIWLGQRAINVVYAAALGLMAIGAGAAAVAPTLVVAGACVVVTGFGNGVASVCNPLLIQRGAPDRLRGRAFTVVMSVTFTFLGLGMAVAGPLTDILGGRWMWGVAAGAFAAASAAALVLGRGIARAPVSDAVAAGAAAP
jgi:MFS family permease